MVQCFVILKIHPYARESKPEANLFRDFLRLAGGSPIRVRGGETLAAARIIETPLLFLFFPYISAVFQNFAYSLAVRLYLRYSTSAAQNPRPTRSVTTEDGNGWPIVMIASGFGSSPFSGLGATPKARLVSDIL